MILNLIFEMKNLRALILISQFFSVRLLFSCRCMPIRKNSPFIMRKKSLKLFTLMQSTADFPSIWQNFLKKLQIFEKKFVICKEAIIQHKIESGGGICLCPNLKDWGKNKSYSKVIDQIENCVKWTCANFCMKAKTKVTNLSL